jgi:DNA-binding YbaB/EbfC family protein
MDIQQMMQQAKVMQDKMQQLQEELSEREVSGQSGGGMVEVVLTCKWDVRNFIISPDIIHKDDKAPLQEMGLPSNMDMPF